MAEDKGGTKRDRLYLEEDADLSVIEGRLVASLGYGSQGHAQAQNLRDSGVEVVIGNVEDHYAERARRDGFEVMPIVEAVKRADIILFLVPDEVQAEVHSEIEPHLREGQVLDFASGYSVHFGVVVPTPFVDVVLCVPTSTGEMARKRYTEGKGTFGHFGVHQDHSGNAREVALALAKGMGFLRFGCAEASFGEEVAINLFAETAGLGAIVKYLLTAYEVLVEAGFSAEAAYSETFYELQFMVEEISRTRLGDTMGSPTSNYLMLSKSGEVVNEDVRDGMRQMLKRVQSGEFVREWNLERMAGLPVFNQLKRERREHEIREVEALFLERKKASGW